MPDDDPSNDREHDPAWWDRHRESDRDERPPRPADARRPPRGDPSLASPSAKRVLAVVAGTMVAVGLLIGVVVLVLGTLGGPELRVQPPSTIEGGERALLADYEVKVDRAITAYAAVKVGEFVAVALAPLLGVFVGVAMVGDRRTHLVATGLGAFVGGVALVGIATLVASTQVPAITAPPGFRPVTVRLILQPAQLAVNATLVGLLSGVAAAAGTVLAGAFRDSPATRI